MIRFYSTAAGDFQMLEGEALGLLKAAGRIAAPRGAIGPDELADALARLRACIAAQTPAPDPAASPQDEPPPISQRQRAYPLIDMLERALTKQVAVLWERR